MDVVRVFLKLRDKLPNALRSSRLDYMPHWGLVLLPEGPWKLFALTFAIVRFESAGRLPLVTWMPFARRSDFPSRFGADVLTPSSLWMKRSTRKVWLTHFAWTSFFRLARPR